MPTQQESKQRTAKLIQAPMRSLPEDLGAEAAVLGSMIIDPRCIGEVVEVLDRTAFFHSEHQHIFDAIVSLWSDSGESAVDGLLVARKLEQNGRWEEIGGGAYLQRVLDTVPSSASVAYYRDIVRNKALLRELIAATTDIQVEAYDDTGDPENKIDAAEQRIFEIADRRATGDAVPVATLIPTVYTKIEKRMDGELTGLRSGYIELDALTTGFQPGDMVILAARPSMGKSACMLNMAENMAFAGTPVAIFSLEMGKLALSERLLVGRAKVDSQRVRHGMTSGDEFQRLAETAGELGDVKIYIDDTPALTPMRLRAKARRLKARHDIQCVFVDYLQLMTMGMKRSDGRQQEVSDISRQLKAMARELNIPVIALSQLNRATESREDHRPRLSDLRESGALEQDADTVLFLHREDYYHRNDPNWPKDNIGEMAVAKQRNGPTGIVRLTFVEQYIRFENLASYV